MEFDLARDVPRHIPEIAVALGALREQFSLRHENRRNGRCGLPIPEYCQATKAFEHEDGGEKIEQPRLTIRPSPKHQCDMHLGLVAPQVRRENVLLPEA